MTKRKEKARKMRVYNRKASWNIQQSDFESNELDSLNGYQTFCLRQFRRLVNIYTPMELCGFIMREAFQTDNPDLGVTEYAAEKIFVQFHTLLKYNQEAQMDYETTIFYPHVSSQYSVY